MNTRTLKDIAESYEGDLIVAGGDFVDTGINYALAAQQMFRTILNTKVGESSLWPYMGFNIYSFEGQNNTEKVGYELARAIKEVLVTNSPFYSNEIITEPYPLTKNSIAIKITLLTVGDPTSFNIIYDTSDNMIKSMVI